MRAIAFVACEDEMLPMAPMTLPLTREAETVALGAALASQLGAGDIVLLKGSLGAGKTTLARALIRAKCGPVEVPSPTFTLVETYDAPDCSIWHFDLYRLEKPQEIWELGVEEAIDEGLCLIEWPERADHLLPRGALEVTLSVDGERRQARLGGGENWRERIAAIAAAFENRDNRAS